MICLNMPTVFMHVCVFENVAEEMTRRFKWAIDYMNALCEYLMLFSHAEQCVDEGDKIWREHWNNWECRCLYLYW